ncbi:hypothetical protein OVS_03340 [Mycoplasma ovis str. Michigan]|uniref:Uncharacterized protein n=1 Tax=Mycoplasma ovis str. Michigan TaxID=1415773 RepID=A0ABM5P1U3_9MOLU|nr:hypothetical protein OVS_03305 [Mycoplasma ovis str. Michigan]AHC40420.1 hypothetical protein OVS_03340 [Mycoplasma ovis str. Michigan]
MYWKNDGWLVPSFFTHTYHRELSLLNPCNSEQDLYPFSNICSITVGAEGAETMGGA